MMIRVTIAVPSAMVEDANALASCLGYSEADEQTFGAANWQDAEGNLYAVASTLAKPSFAGDAFGELSLPAWSGDLDAALRAQALLAVGLPASPAAIAAIIDDDPQAALSVLGVTPLPVPE